MKLPNLPSEIEYGALLAYSPRGTSAISVRSRDVVRDGVKYDRPGIIEKAAVRLVEHLADSGLAAFFDGKTALVPVPRSRPLPEGALWPGLRICEEIRKIGLGKEILPCLARMVAVQKSAFAGAGERPGWQEHMETIRCTPRLLQPEKITLVDDFVTRGASLLACSALIKECFPEAQVRAFALVRTCGRVPDIERLVEPVVGRIWIESGALQREP
jgi:hypothetical protein